MLRTLWQVAKNSTRLKQDVTLPDLYQQYRHCDAHQETRRGICSACEMEHDCNDKAREDGEYYQVACIAGRIVSHLISGSNEGLTPSHCRH
jgi:hypothetical protein